MKTYRKIEIGAVRKGKTQSIKISFLAHDTPSSMLKESLDEYLEVAKFCYEYKKIDDKWKPFNKGGCLGYPGGVILFSIIDSIGSYFRNNKNFKMQIDAKEVSINSVGWEHFKILNSKYFNQNLSEDFIKVLYNKFRSILMHNSVLGKDARMISNNEAIPKYQVRDEAFFIGKNMIDGNNIYMISLKELYELCKTAVEEF